MLKQLVEHIHDLAHGRSIKLGELVVPAADPGLVALAAKTICKKIADNMTVYPKDYDDIARIKESEVLFWRSFVAFSASLHPTNPVQSGVNEKFWQGIASLLMDLLRQIPAFDEVDTTRMIEEIHLSFIHHFTYYIYHPSKISVEEFEEMKQYCNKLSTKTD